MTFDLMETTEIHKVVQKSPPKTVQIVNKRWLLYLRESERETERQRESIQKIRTIAASTYTDILTSINSQLINCVVHI